MKNEINIKEEINKLINEMGSWDNKKHISQVKYYKILRLVRHQIKLQLKIYDLYRELERGIIQRAKRDGYNLEEKDE